MNDNSALWKLEQESSGSKLKYSSNPKVFVFHLANGTRDRRTLMGWRCTRTLWRKFFALVPGLRPPSLNHSISDLCKYEQSRRDGI